MIYNHKYAALIREETRALTEYTHLRAEVDRHEARKIRINVALVIAVVVTFSTVVLSSGMAFMIPLAPTFALILWAMFHNFGPNVDPDLDKKLQASAERHARANEATIDYDFS